MVVIWIYCGLLWKKDTLEFCYCRLAVLVSKSWLRLHLYPEYSDDVALHVLMGYSNIFFLVWALWEKCEVKNDILFCIGSLELLAIVKLIFE